VLDFVLLFLNVAIPTVANLSSSSDSVTLFAWHRFRYSIP
jgi:hypothetical protein